MRPDLLIVGDSHTGALHEAAKARGLDARLLYISGNFWHENRIRHDPRRGFSAGYRPGLNRKVLDFAMESGAGSVLPAGVPILASFGYHLGRLAPIFARQGHSPDADHAEAEDRLFVSSAFLDAYIQARRGTLLRILRLAGRRADLVVVAPPLIQTDPVAMGFARHITDYLIGQGIRVFDPRHEPDWAGLPLATELRAPDGVHGNAAYGEQVLQRIVARGLLELPARSG